MTLTKRFGVDAGTQVPLSVANAQAARASIAMREREDAAADAAAQAVMRTLKGADRAPKRSTKALRAQGKRKEV